MPAKQKELARRAENKRANCKSSKENMTGKRLKGSWRGPISLLLGWVQMVSAEAAHSCREQVQGQTDAALGLGRRLEAGRKLVFPSSKQQHAKERGGGRAAFRWRRNSSVTLHFRSMMGR